MFRRISRQERERRAARAELETTVQADPLDSVKNGTPP